MARQCEAGIGRLGAAGRGMAWPGMAWQARRGEARRGAAGPGLAGLQTVNKHPSPRYCCTAERDTHKQRGSKMTTLKLLPLNLKTVRFTIRGTSPLVQHAWSEKSLRMMRMTALERRKQPKVARHPQSEAEAATYRTDEGDHGIPLLAFKASLISAAHKDLGIEKTLVKKSLFIPSTDSGRVVKMECSEPVCREDIVRIGANQTDLRYRPEFGKWSAVITATVDFDNLQEQDLVNLINRAGFGVGIGEWRPEKGGEYGRYELDTSKPFEVF